MDRNVLRLVQFALAPQDSAGFPAEQCAGAIDRQIETSYMARFALPPSAAGVADLASARAAGLARLQAALKDVDVINNPALGLYMRPWITVKYPQIARSVGRFEADFFDPLAWKPEYPNPAFDRMQPDDAFWAARIVAKFSDEAIRAVVAKARYSERAAAEYIATTLIKRRDKVLKT